MHRLSVRYKRTFLAALVLAVLPAVGCQSIAFTAMYLLKGTDVEPDFKDLKGKKVVVVCRPAEALQYSSSNVGRDLAHQVTLLLQKEVPKIKTVDQQKVGKWTDENTWEEYVEVGKALKADMVVAIDLDSFSIYQGQTLYQGKANAVIRVYDCKNGGKEVFHKNLPPSIYPPNSSVPASERTESEFRREFVLVMANQIGRYFYAHDPHADMGLDAQALK